MPPEDVSEYVLSDDESERIWAEHIRPSEFSDLDNFVPSDSALAVIAVGQTGAGKSNYCLPVLEHLRDNGRDPFHFIADTYKTFHPRYDELRRQKPHLASRATGIDARRWLSIAVAEAMHLQADIVLESATRYPLELYDLLRMLRNDGYRIEVVMLAVPAALSRIGILVRYHLNLAEAQSRTLPLRLTPKIVHDTSYRGLTEVSRHFESTKFVDQLLVVRRGGLVAYGQTRVSGLITLPGVADALEIERQRPLTQAEMDQALKDIQLLESFPSARDEIPEIRELLSPLLRRPSSAVPNASPNPAYVQWQPVIWPTLVPIAYGKVGSDNTPAMHLLRLGEP